jgi:hypothetical protein
MSEAQSWRVGFGHPLRQAYARHRWMAERRGIGFELTFFEWLTIWRDSGHINERGQGRGRYCMARLRDQGVYVLGNVKIILNEDNSREAPRPVFTDELRRKLSEAQRGHPVSAETRKKLSEHFRGRPTGRKTVHSADARRKMSEAVRRAWERGAYDHVQA